MSPLLLIAILLPAGVSAQTSWRTRSSSDPALDGKQRINVLVKANFLSTGALMRVVGPAIGTQFGNTPKEWERTAEGFGRRVGTQFAVQTTQGLIVAGSSAMLGHDPRYQRCGCKGLFKRTGHAVSGLFLTADGSGARGFDPSNLFAAYGAGYVGASLYPDRYRVSVKGYQLGSQQVGQIAIQNLALEFGPDIGRFLKRKVLRR